MFGGLANGVTSCCRHTELGSNIYRVSPSFIMRMHEIGICKYFIRVHSESLIRLWNKFRMALRKDIVFVCNANEDKNNFGFLIRK